MHPLDDHPLPGIGPARRRRLTNAGVLTLQDLVELGVDGVSELPHIPRSVAEAAVLAAASVLQATRGPEPTAAAPELEPEPAPPVEAATPDRARPDTEGPPAPPPKKAPRNRQDKKQKTSQKKAPKRPNKRKKSAEKDRLANLLRDATKHAKKAPKGKQRRKMRALLDNLGDTLERLPKRRKKLPKKRQKRLAKLLSRIEDTLTTLVSRKPRPKRLRKARRQVREVHDAVRSTLKR